MSKSLRLWSLLCSSRSTLSNYRSDASERLAPYKVPNEIRVIRALPVASTGKVSKARLAEMIAGGGVTA